MLFLKTKTCWLNAVKLTSPLSTPPRALTLPRAFSTSIPRLDATQNPGTASPLPLSPSPQIPPASEEAADASVSATKAYTYKRTHRRKRTPSIPSPPSPTAEEAVTNILYNTPPNSAAGPKRHILNCIVQDEPGVLSRVAGILAARGFNIDSLVVSRTEIEDLSRMTIALKGEHAIIEQARKQLEDLVPVWAVLDFTTTKLVEREMLLVKVSTIGLIDNEDASDEPLLLETSHQRRHHLTELSKLFNGKVVDVAEESIIVELCAKPERVDVFLRLVKPFGIVEATRSGTMAMTRSHLFEDEDVATIEDKVGSVDESMLPPG